MEDEDPEEEEEEEEAEEEEEDEEEEDQQTSWNHMPSKWQQHRQSKMNPTMHLASSSCSFLENSCVRPTRRGDRPSDREPSRAQNLT